MSENKIQKRRWGRWEVLGEGRTIFSKWKVKLLYMDPQKSISKQFHAHREEYWIVMQGTAKAEISIPQDSPEYPLSEVPFVLREGFYLKVEKGQIHKVTNVGICELIILELQMGDEVEENDIIRLEKIYGEDENRNSDQ